MSVGQIQKPSSHPQRRRLDVGGKMYEVHILNIRLSKYGYRNSIDLLKDFRDGKFPENFFAPPTDASPLF
jgi:hypothetical protein